MSLYGAARVKPCFRKGTPLTQRFVPVKYGYLIRRSTEYLTVRDASFRHRDDPIEGGCVGGVPELSRKLYRNAQVLMLRSCSVAPTFLTYVRPDTIRSHPCPGGSTNGDSQPRPRSHRAA